MNVEEQLPLIKELKTIIDQKVPDEDYQQQVDRWNHYREALYKVQMQCQILDLRFRQKMVTSYSERRMRNTRKIGAVAAVVAALVVMGMSLFSMTLPKFIPLNSIAVTGCFVFVYAVALGIFTMLNSGKLPEKVKFSVSASIRYDEQFYVQRFLRGMQRERKDPKIDLPPLTMEIPQTWLKQQALLKIMGTMNEAKLS